MGATLRSFPKALSTTISSPLLILITLVTLTTSMIIGAMFSLIPFFGQLVAGPLVATIMAGIIGMVGYASYQNRAVDTGDYFESIKDRGPKVFAVVLIEQLIFFFISIFFFILFFFAFGLGGAFLGQTAQNPEQAAAISGSLSFGFIAAFGLFMLSSLALITIFQFLTVSIIIGDQSVTDSFKTSVSISKSNPLSVIGYTLSRGTLLIGSIVLSLLLLTLAIETAEVIGVIIGGLVLIAIFAFVSTFFYALHAHYYLELPNTPVNIIDSKNTHPSQQNTDHKTEEQQDTQI